MADGARVIDVLVVGLGPAGASAAAHAARAGLSVLAIERNAAAGLPVQCAEFVPLMLGTGHLGHGETRIQPIDRMDTYVGIDAAELTPDFRGVMIDRAAFDQSLIAEAEEAGAECRFATPLKALDADGSALLGDGTGVRARVVIGADGPRSPVGRAIGAINTELVETRQITVDLVAPHPATDIFLSADIVGGYAWLFPKGDVANLGLGVIPSAKAALKPLLDALHARLVAEGRIGAAIHRHTGGLIPVGGLVGGDSGPIGQLGDTTVMLAGDAAGLTNPITGAGIATAVLSGRMAGDAAAAYLKGDNDAAADYAEELADVFGPSLALALKRRAQLVAAYERGAMPDGEDLRATWIAFPQYWDREAPQRSAPAVEEVCTEVKEPA